MIMIGPFVIDAALNEQRTNEADVTEFPVENGSTFTDNVRIRPKRYKMEGIVSDTPVDDYFRRVADDGSAVVDESTAPSAQARVGLQALFDAGLPIRIVTTDETLENMVLKNLDWKKDGDTGDAFPFTVDCIQINIVDNVRSFVKVKFTAVDQGNKAAHPPGWIGTDTLGRDIVAQRPGPGLPVKYYRADGTEVSADEAKAATRRQGNVQTVFDQKTGKAELVQPGSPYYAPQSPLPAPVHLPGLGG